MPATPAPHPREQDRGVGDVNLPTPQSHLKIIKPKISQLTSYTIVLLVGNFHHEEARGAEQRRAGETTETTTFQAERRSTW